MSSKFQNVSQLIRKGHFMVLAKEFKKRLHSRSVSFGLQRDMEDEFSAPFANIEIQVRPLRKDDVDTLLDSSGDPSVNPRIIAGQQGMVDENIPTCYVAVTNEDKPCYMQWLIGYGENEKIKSHFKGVFPPLKRHEALLEAAYSNPSYRGLRIMPRAMALIAEKAAEVDARWVNTFVDATNIPSLKGCRRSGFKPYLIRKDRWFLFTQTITFHPVSDSMTEIFYEVTDADRNKTDNSHHIPMPNLSQKVDQYT